MLLPFTTPPGSKYRFIYQGPVGVAGVNVTQSFDIAALPKYVRDESNFKDNWRVFVRQVSEGVSDVSPDVSFTPAAGTPTALVLTLTAAAPTDVIDIEAWFLHSVVR